MRVLVAGLCLVLALAPRPARAQPARPDPQLNEGLRQLAEGDYEGAVTTLQAVVARLSDDRARSGEVTRALVHLGIAHVALDQIDAAKARFREALARDPALTLNADRFSPKIIRTFEAAREEARQAGQATPAKRQGGRGRTALIVVAAAGAAAAGIALAAGGEQAGTPTVANAHFGTTVLLCENGSISVPLPFTILADATNPSDAPLSINSATTTIIIEQSSITGEIGFASNEPSTFSPRTVGGGGRATIEVRSTLPCGNGAGDPMRFNVWIGRVTFATSAGVFTVQTQDRMRVNIP